LQAKGEGKDLSLSRRLLERQSALIPLSIHDSDVFHLFTS
jgi:hypothetical protein